jgi:K+-transporting ATPase ATPase C chain
MKTNLFPALKLTLLCIVFFVIIYSLLIFGAAFVSAPNHGRGEVVEHNSKVVGFANVGQKFTDDKYFWSRPSAVEYNAAGSAGSNKGPSNPDYLQTIQARIDTFLVHNPGIQKSQIPVELVTASGSGLDPHISPQAAFVQSARIAHARSLTIERINTLIDQHTQKPFFGFWGTSTVNVLRLNIALDKLN